MTAHEIWVYAAAPGGEPEPSTLELIEKALHLGKTAGMPVCAVLAERVSTDAAGKLQSYGLAKVYRVITGTEAELAPDTAAAAICAAVRIHHPEILLFSAEAPGRELAARTAAALNVGLTADCTDLQIDEASGKLVQIKPAFGAQMMAELMIPHCTPQIATLIPGSGAKAESISREQRIIEVPGGGLPQPATRITAVITVERTQAAGLADAEIVVACGRGVGGQKGVAMAEALANALGGAVGCTKAVTDAGWMPRDRMIGQTGTSVSPKLYIACGISGAVQHAAGIDGRSVKVAINSDPHASIFETADYGIVGDLFEVIPALIEVLDRQSIKL